MLFDPAILILDEATASVDAESERAICRAVKRFSRHRTTIAIAHRLSTLRDADKLLVFDQGRLIEEGSPKNYSTGRLIQHPIAYSRQPQRTSPADGVGGGRPTAARPGPADLGPDACSRRLSPPATPKVRSPLPRSPGHPSNADPTIFNFIGSTRA